MLFYINVIFSLQLVAQFSVREIGLLGRCMPKVSHSNDECRTLKLAKLECVRFPLPSPSPFPYLSPLPLPLPSPSLFTHISPFLRHLRPSLLSLSSFLPHPFPLTIPSLPSRQIQLGGLRECCKLPSGVRGGAPAANAFMCH